MPQPDSRWASRALHLPFVAKGGKKLLTRPAFVSAKKEDRLGTHQSDLLPGPQSPTPGTHGSLIARQCRRRLLHRPLGKCQQNGHGKISAAEDTGGTTGFCRPNLSILQKPGSVPALRDVCKNRPGPGDGSREPSATVAGPTVPEARVVSPGAWRRAGSLRLPAAVATRTRTRTQHPERKNSRRGWLCDRQDLVTVPRLFFHWGHGRQQAESHRWSGHASPFQYGPRRPEESDLGHSDTVS